MLHAMMFEADKRAAAGGVRAPAPYAAATVGGRREAVNESYASAGNLALLRGAGGSPVAAGLRPSRTGVLQRKCACGGSAGVAGHCAACSAKARAQSLPDAVPAQPQSDSQQPEPAGKPGTPSLEKLMTYLCAGHSDPDRPQTRAFTAKEQAIVSSALWNARSLSGGAYQKLAQRDPLHLKVADRAFHAPVTFDVLDDRVARIKAKLGTLHLDGTIDAGTCDDEVCGDNSIAYTKPDLSRVVICPFFFLLNPVSQAITLVHEAGHMAAIDVNWQPGNEVYCRGDESMDCSDICNIAGQNLMENVDAWARFIYCLALSP